MSYIFITESDEISKNISNTFKKSINDINNVIRSPKARPLGLKKIKAETISPEEMYDVESFHKDIEETTTTGGVGGTFEGPLSSTPMRRSSLFAPEGSPEHEEGNKILKKMEKPMGKVFTKKGLEESFLVSEEELEEGGTTTGSVGGSYVQPKIWAKNRSEWRGTKKLYPGGKFVHPKDKCKNYPYCDESPDAVELTDYPKDKLDNLFSENKKDLYDMSEDEIWNKRDSDYIRLVEILSSVQNVKQFPVVEKLVELFRKKFDGYISKYLNKNIDDMLKSKYEELNVDNLNEDDSKKNDDNKSTDLDKTIKVINSSKNVGQFNSALKMMINFRLKYENKLSGDEIDKLNNTLHNKIKEFSTPKKKIEETTRTSLKLNSVHKKIKD